MFRMAQNMLRITITFLSIIVTNVQWYHQWYIMMISSRGWECKNLIVPEVIFERESVRSSCYWHDFDYVPQACLYHVIFITEYRVSDTPRDFSAFFAIFFECIPTSCFRNESIECKIMARSAGRKFPASRREEKKLIPIRPHMRSFARKCRAHVHSNEIPTENYRRESTGNEKFTSKKKNPVPTMRVIYGAIINLNIIYREELY